MRPTAWLSRTIWITIACGVLSLAFNDRHAAMVRQIALIGAVLGLAASLPLYAGFDTQTAAMQFVELSAWIPRFNISYNLGVDGISVLFILLNSFITVLGVIAGWESIQRRVAARCPAQPGGRVTYPRIGRPAIGAKSAPPSFKSASRSASATRTKSCSPKRPANMLPLTNPARFPNIGLAVTAGSSGSSSRKSFLACSDGFGSPPPSMGLIRLP